MNVELKHCETLEENPQIAATISLMRSSASDDFQPELIFGSWHVHLRKPSLGASRGKKD
jgi:hypothetical protein